MSAEFFPFPEEPLGRVPQSCTWRREADPLGQVTLPSGDEVRLAVRFLDVEAVLTDPRFSRDLSKPGCPRLQSGADMSDDRDTLINMDPPRHSRVRKLLSRAFTVRNIEKLRPRVREIVQELVDGMLASPRPVDLMAALAEPLPMRVIAGILGVADSDLDKFRHWSYVAMSITPDMAQERVEGREEFFAYLLALIERHGREPGTDLLDTMIEASEDGDRLSGAELCDTARSLLLAGHETTMTSIGRGVFTLLRHPEQYAELVADPRLVPAAVEETLRYDFPADVGFLRVATEDVELPSGTVRRGEGVMPLISSAHADSKQFTDPEVFDIHRTDNAHIAFGKGPHYCIGGHLARVQLQEAYDVLVRTFPNLRLAVPAEEIVWKPDMMTHAIAELPLTW
ncbi:cytochrome P450 [Streptomyces sp. N2-109]|uniref:Cytochrome P450 n=1 Tax=Streptomyces gossypii TaxID=2883101 RepID=A0ABT2JMV8_9ACTN|nr:cytochrome P450 [Streptomyces gossypii]MCT2589156.1 cytochrome P450 [Streptomyces gossypii]